MSFSDLRAHCKEVFLFFSEGFHFLDGIIVDDAKYFSIVITVLCSSSVIATVKVDSVDVGVIDIDIERIGMCDDT